MATSQAPVFPMPELHHFSDYGFDPQIDYFQEVLQEESKRHNKRGSYYSRSIDTLHFKLQKPISKDDLSNANNKKKKKSAAAANRRRWWKNTLLFFKSRWTRPMSPPAPFGPIYITESLSGSGASGPSTPAMIPYVSLTQLNMDHHHIPIYLVA